MFSRLLGGERKLSRRQMLGGAGAAAAAAAVGASPAGAAEVAVDDGASWQGGVFGGMVSERQFWFRRNFNGETAVYTLAQDARVFHGGGPAPITAYSDGEEMTVFVSDGEQRIVTEVEHLNRYVQATIEARDGETLETSGGTLTIAAETRVLGAELSDQQETRTLDQLADGDRIVAVGRRLPHSRTMELGIIKQVEVGDR